MTPFVIGWFGKLPLSPEFIKHNHVGPVFADLDQWTQEGLVYFRSHFEESWIEDYGKAEPWNFLWCPPDQDEFLVGTAIPSTDKAGRHFPFLLFSRMSRQRFQNQPFSGLAWCMEFLQEARSMGQNRWQDNDLATFKAELARLSFPPIENFELEEHREHYKQYIETQSTEHFLIDLFGENHYPQKASLLKNIKKYLHAVPAGRSAAPHVGLKFPLAATGTLPQPFDLLFWGDMANKLFSPHAIPSYVFWNRHHIPEQSYMLLFFKKPGPQAFPGLIRPETEDPSWYNFVSPTMNEGLHDQEEDGSESPIPLEGTSRSLQEWLNQCCVV